MRASIAARRWEDRCLNIWGYLYEQENWGLDRLARATGLAPMTVRRYLSGRVAIREIKRTPRSIDPNRTPEIIRLVTEEKLTYVEVGSRFGITRERVRQLLKNAGFSGEELHALVLARTPDPPTHRTCERCGEEYEIGKGDEHWERGKHLTLAWGSKSDLTRWRAIADDYENPKMRVADIIEKWGTEPSTINRIREHFGIPRRRPEVGRKSKTNVEALAKKDAIADDLASQTMTKGEIAERHGVSTWWVDTVAKQRGLTLTRSQAMLLRWQRIKAQPHAAR